MEDNVLPQEDSTERMVLEGGCCYRGRHRCIQVDVHHYLLAMSVSASLLQ